jgi:hypothetical protein
MLARLRIILLSFLSILSFDECQVCVHYLEYTILTPIINISVLASIIIQVHIHTRLLSKCFHWENINYPKYFQVKCYNDNSVRLRINI